MAAGAAIQTTLGELCGESVVTALAIHDDLEMGVGALVEGTVVFGADRQAPGCELAPFYAYLLGSRTCITFGAKFCRRPWYT